MINESHQEEFVRNLFKNFREEELSASFTTDVMKRIEGEVRKTRRRMIVMVVVGSLAAVVAGFVLWSNNPFVTYANIFSDFVKEAFRFEFIKKAFAFESITLPASSGLGIMVGVTAMTLLFADLFFEMRRKRKKAESLES